MKAMRVKKMLAEKKVTWLLLLWHFSKMGRSVGGCQWVADVKVCSPLIQSACFSIVFPGPQSDQETDLQEGWKVPQGVQADVQTWNPSESYCSQSGKLLCACWAQTGLCHQDQRVSSVLTWDQNYPACPTHHLTFTWITRFTTRHDAQAVGAHISIAVPAHMLCCCLEMPLPCFCMFPMVLNVE